MHETYCLLVTVIVLAVIFDFINGFHDTANAIATSVSTRVLSPKVAVAMAAVMNLVGALSGTAVAKMVGGGLVEAASVTQVTVVSALLAAIAWDLLTWYFGLPTSSSHAVIASIVGASVATSGTNIVVANGVYKVLLGLLLSPVVGFALGYVTMVLIMHLFDGSTPARVNQLFTRLQVVSAAYMAFSHGNNDAQKTMGIITMALVSYYRLPTFEVPSWVIFVCALAMAAGTAAGGWRIIKTLGGRLTALRPVQGFAAEASAATVIELASRMGLPLSTTHVITATIMGVGTSRRVTAVRWVVGANIVVAWILTIPACGVLSWTICKAVSLVF